MYVQPLYAARDSSSPRALQFVLVSYGDQVGIGKTLDEAIVDVLGGEADPHHPDRPGTPTDPETARRHAAQGGPPPPRAGVRGVRRGRPAPGRRRHRRLGRGPRGGPQLRRPRAAAPRRAQPQRRHSRAHRRTHRHRVTLDRLNARAAAARRAPAGAVYSPARSGAIETADDRLVKRYEFALNAPTTSAATAARPQRLLVVEDLAWRPCREHRHPAADPDFWPPRRSAEWGSPTRVEQLGSLLVITRLEVQLGAAIRETPGYRPIPTRWLNRPRRIGYRSVTALWKITSIQP